MSGNSILSLSHDLVIMVGSPASGKSFYSRELEASFGYDRAAMLLEISEDNLWCNAPRVVLIET